MLSSGIIKIIISAYVYIDKYILVDITRPGDIHIFERG